METNKLCARCQQDFSRDHFYPGKQWSDGLHPYCKKCHQADQKARRERKRAESPGHHRWKRDLIRHDYFACIDSSIKAYVLGVLAADGNVQAKHHRITLELSAKDANLLETVRDELVPEGAITGRHRRGFNYLTLAFVSRQMVNDLDVLGVTAAKSLTLAWPEKLPLTFAREFILGYFDGDGFITYHERPNRRYPYIGFTSGSPNFLVRVANVIEHHTGIRPGGPWNSRSNAYKLRAAGNDALIIDAWLHTSGLGLQRKRLVRENFNDQDKV